MIESSGVGMQAHTIKTHHNVGGLPKRMKLALIEPLRDLFKDEVRKLRWSSACRGRWSTASPSRPRPGDPHYRRGDGRAPAPAARGGPHRARRDRDGRDGAPMAVLRGAAGGQDGGVMGDARTYGYPLVIRAVSSEDAMTADWSKIPYKNLERISSRIIGEVKVSTASAWI